MSRNFSEVAAYLRAMIVTPHEIRVGDWLDTRCDPLFDPSQRDVGYVFDLDRLDCAVVVHREGLRSVTVPRSLKVTVYRPVEQCSPPLHCEFTCQCSRWHDDCKRRASVTAEDRLRRQVKELQEELAFRTGERDGLQRSLGTALRKVQQAKAALNGDLVG